MFASVKDVIIHEVLAARPWDLGDDRSIILKNPDFDLEDKRAWPKELDRLMETDTFSKQFIDMHKAAE